MKVSIIILSFNTRDLLRECLGSLVKIGTVQNYHYHGRWQNVPLTGVEIIVVDNASGDGSAEMVKDEFPRVKLIRSSKNLGFAAGNNLGAKNAKGEYLFFLNSDTRLQAENNLLEAVRYFKENSRVGILSFQLVNSDGSVQKSGRNFPSFWREICYYGGLWGLSPKFFSDFFDFSKHQDFNKTQEVEDGGGAAIMMWRKLFEELGGWDERFFMYYEDADLSRRVWQAGFKVVYFPLIKVIHHQGQSEKITPGAQKYLWQSLLKYAQKWWPAWQVWVLQKLLVLKSKP